MPLEQLILLELMIGNDALPLMVSSWPFSNSMTADPDSSDRLPVLMNWPSVGDWESSCHLAFSAWVRTATSVALGAMPWGELVGDAWWRSMKTARAAAPSATKRAIRRGRVGRG